MVGRLQFELAESLWDIQTGEITLMRGQTCISVHIPGGCALEEQACEQSYAWACEFFRKWRGMENCVFVCDSWLMHPWLSECLPSHTGIVRFQQKYCIVKAWDDFATFSYWVFPGCAGKALSAYPADTTLRRLALQRVKAGLPIGKGLGIRTAPR